MRIAARQLQCHTAGCVRSALESEPELAGLRVGVVADGQGLCLCGSVDGEEDAQRVLRFVRVKAPGLRIRDRMVRAGAA